MTLAATAAIHPDHMKHIRAKLKALKEEHGVRILLAVESGSRAWGFPSADSDYDVRFVYARPQDDYLSVKQERDVIETPPMHDEALGVPMDMNGWDIRKALVLATKSNATFVEWLASPITYMAEEEAVGEMLVFCRMHADFAALSYHYHRLARNAWEQVEADVAETNVKRYCYALRPALALKWIRSRKQLPPMNMRGLCAGLSISEELEEHIELLIAAKARAKESDTMRRDPVLDKFIAAVLAPEVPRPVAVNGDGAALEDADRLFKELISPPPETAEN